MSEYVLKVDDEPQAEALLTYLRSLNFVELVHKPTKQEAKPAMKLLLTDLPDQQVYSQQDVNQGVNEIRARRNEGQATYSY